MSRLPSGSLYLVSWSSDVTADREIPVTHDRDQILQESYASTKRVSTSLQLDLSCIYTRKNISKTIFLYILQFLNSKFLDSPKIITTHLVVERMFYLLLGDSSRPVTRKCPVGAGFWSFIVVRLSCSRQKANERTGPKSVSPEGECDRDHLTRERRTDEAYRTTPSRKTIRGYGVKSS